MCGCTNIEISKEIRFLVIPLAKLLRVCNPKLSQKFIRLPLFSKFQVSHLELHNSSGNTITTKELLFLIDNLN